MPLPTNRFQEALLLIRLASRDRGTTFTELESDYDLPRKKVMELIDCLTHVSIPPEGPDDILDVGIDGTGRIRLFFPLRLNLPMNLGEMDTIAMRLALVWGIEHRVFDAGIGHSILGKIEASRGGLATQIDTSGVEVHFPRESDESNLLPALREAITQATTIEINYYSQSRGTTSKRVVLPFRLVLSECFWYLQGYQTGKESGWRSFRVDRIESLSVLGDRFDREGLPDRDKSRYLFRFEEERTCETRTRFFPGAARYIREAFSAEMIEGEEDGSLVLNFASVGFPFYRSFVLSHGALAEALTPESFRIGIAETLEEMLASNSEESSVK